MSPYLNSNCNTSPILTHVFDKWYIYIYRFIMIREIFQTWRIWVRTPILLLDPCSIPHLGCKSLNSIHCRYGISSFPCFSVVFIFGTIMEHLSSLISYPIFHMENWSQNPIFHQESGTIVFGELGKSMEKLMEFDGKRWNTYGKPMENLWKTYGKPMENLWKTYGKPMEKIDGNSQRFRPSPSSSGSVYSWLWLTAMGEMSSPLKNVTWTYDLWYL